MSKDLTKLHYQMLRKTTSGETIDEALIQLKSKVVGNSVQPGEPVVIFYDDTSGKTGAHLAVPTSGITAGDEEGYMFPNRREVFERMEEDEEVTTAALIDLDDRINTVSGDVQTLTERINSLDFSDLDDIVLTENVTALGVSAGAISNGTTISGGTTFTQFVRKLLIQTMDYTPVKPSLKWASSAALPSGTIEVGSDVSFTFATDKTNGSFTGATANGFNPSVSGAGDTFGSVTYTVLSGTSSLITATTTTSYSINAIPEGNYTVKASVPYTGVTAANLHLTKNTGEVSQASFPNGTASASAVTFNVRYKAYYGTTTATGNTTSHNFVFSGNDNNVVTSNSEWLNTKGEKMIKETTWSNEGKNMFVLTNGTLSYIESAKMPDTNLKGNFELIDSNYQVSIGGTQTANYKLYLYTVDGGTTVEYRKLKITR
jgi:hypothetical protein